MSHLVEMWEIHRIHVLVGAAEGGQCTSSNFRLGGTLISNIQKRMERN